MGRVYRADESRTAVVIDHVAGIQTVNGKLVCARSPIDDSTSRDREHPTHIEFQAGSGGNVNIASSGTDAAGAESAVNVENRIAAGNDH